jgi:dipeptidyl aminopeptidase/acylaminoacyl peptidase
VDPAADLTRNTAPIAPTVDDPYYSQGGTAAARAAAAEEDPLAEGGLFDAGTRFELSSGRENDVIDPETGFGFAPLSPEVFDLDPESSQHIRVRTVSESRIVLHRLDVTSGSTTVIADFPIDPDRQLLADRQGTPRLSAPASTNTAFPHQAHLERGPGSRGRGNLAGQVGLPETAFDVSPENFFSHRALPLGFDEKPHILYFASNLGRDTYGIYAADLESGKTTDLALEHPTLDLIPRPHDAFLPSGTLVFDRHNRQLRGIRVTDRQHTTRWFDPVLQSTQSTLEQALPGRNVEILEWDASVRRLVVFSSSTTDPGRFHVYDRQTKQLVEFAQRSPWLNAGPATRTIRFSMTTARGHDVACQVTLPQSPRVLPAPIVVVCPSNPWDRLSPEFQPEVNALARMGFAVLQYAGRGAWGRGVKHREAVREGYADAQLEDLLSVLDEAGRGLELDTRHVGLVGTGHGGHLALLALATHPDRFRCAVALEPPIDLAAWLRRDDWASRSPATQLTRSYYGDAAWLKARNLADTAERITRPAFILSYPGEDGSWRRSTHLSASAFARRLGARNPDSQFQSLSHDFVKGLPRAKAAVFGEIERFLNANVYNFGVTIGESVEVN